MAVLAEIKKSGGIVKKIANKGANIVAKASSLSSLQLENVEKNREEYLSEMPETDPESIERFLGSYAIEAYEAYLPQLSKIYTPMPPEDYSDAIENNRLRYFEITKWVSDPSEDNMDKLTNLYHVLSDASCNLALVFCRKRKGCRVYFAIANTGESDEPSIATNQKNSLIAAIKGNFPGVEIKNEGKNSSGQIPELSEMYAPTISVVSNIASEKSKQFRSQSIEKLLDGIVPHAEEDEYTIILLGTPVPDQLERKSDLSELYSKLKPYADWSKQFTYTETQAQGASATVGVNLGGSVGKTTGTTTGSGESVADTKGDTQSTAENQGESKGTNTNESDTSGSSKTEGTSKSQTDSDTTGVNASVNAGLTQTVGASASATLGAPNIASVSASVNESTAVNVNATLGGSKSWATSNTSGTSQSTAETISKTIGKGKSYLSTVSKSVSNAKNAAKTVSKFTQKAANSAINTGINFGANFARSSTVNVMVGKNETLVQNFNNFGVKNALDIIEKHIKRIEKSTALGMWDFAAYFISDNPAVAKSAAHMYLALTQGEESYVSQSSVNTWGAGKNGGEDAKNLMGFLKRMQHPEFELINPADLDDFNEEHTNWFLYPPHVDATVGITGRELAYSLNMPKKSVSGLPVIESAAFGREVQTFSPRREDDAMIAIGKVYHMRRVEDIRVMLHLNSLCSHTFVTGSTGTGKSNFIYQLLDQTLDESDDISFMVIEPAKGEYKQVFGGRRDVKVYGTNPLYAELLRINPFSFPKGIGVLEHIDRLTEIFNACWPMYAAMPAVLKDAIELAYREKGWVFSNYAYYSTDFPTFADLMQALPKVMENSLYSADTKSDYQGALITRVKSLTNGINGEIFCSNNEIANHVLFDKNVIADISRVGSAETKSLIMGILVMKLQEYRMQSGRMNANLKHITVIEEAHNLLRKTSFAQAQEGANLQGKSVEMLTNAIAEMRTYGEGFVIADQAPGLLDEAVIRNTNTKVIFRLPNEQDALLVGNAIALKDEQIRELSKLPAFVAAVYQNDWVEAVLFKSNQFNNGKLCRSHLMRPTISRAG